MHLNDLPVVALDIQTTGATPKQGRVLEIAWSAVTAAAVNRQGVDQCLEAYLVRSTSPHGTDAADEVIPPRILKMTGLRSSDMANGEAEQKVFARLVEHLRYVASVSLNQRPIIVAHVATFEARFVDDMCRRFGGVETAPIWICTHQIARRLYPDLPSRSLRALAGYFGHSISSAKRASAHVLATARIWHHLCQQLASREGITTEEALRAWIARKAPQRNPGRSYPIDREHRLAVPDCPGVYRLLARDGRTLYVGKASSLKSRVNSYFRQSRGHSSAKLEMLTQVFSVATTPCDTPLEAALKESDEIKRLVPPYNIALQAQGRMLGYVDRQLSPISQASEAAYGPFARPDALSDLCLLGHLTKAWCSTTLVKKQEILRELLYGDVDEAVLCDGIAVFEQTEAWACGVSARGLLAMGIRSARRLAAEDNRTDLENSEEDDDEKNGGIGAEGADSELKASDPEVGAIALTGHDIARKLAAIPLAAGRTWLRARRLARLRYATVSFRAMGSTRWRYLQVVGGQIQAVGWRDDLKKLDMVQDDRWHKGCSAWTACEQLDIATYDRVRVLASELRRMQRDSYDIAIQFADDYRGVMKDGMDSVFSSTHRDSAKDDRTSAS